MKITTAIALTFFTVSAFACGPDSDVICTGDYALNRNYDVKITQIYGNGTAKLKFLVDGSEGVFPLSEVHKVRNQYKGWMTGDKGLNRNYDVEVVKIYGNGSARLKFEVDGSEGVYPLSEVDHAVSRQYGWRVGDSGQNRNYEVVIMKIYTNGKAKLKFMTDGSEGIYPLTEVSKSVNELDGLSVGDIAMNRNYEVEILNIYDNGKARLRFKVDGSVGVYPLSEIVKVVDCIAK